jgi:putative ABC transport system permease protein
METFARDVRQVWRLLAGNRGFAAAALVTIALGVGGTSAVFSVVYGVLLRPLPYPEPERIVRLWEVHPGAQLPMPGAFLSHPTYRAWSRASRSVEALGAFRGADYTVTQAGVAQRLRGTKVTPSVFRLLRVSPAAGRFFTEADAGDGAAPVVVLAHGLWRDRFGGDRAAIGRRLTIDGVDHEIVGVAPPGFAFPEREVGLRDDRRELTLYTPYVVRAMPADARVIDFSNTIARLAPGATIEQAEAEGASYARGVERPLADMVFGRGGRVEVRVRSLVDQMTTRVRPALTVLAAGVALVLMIACANVANLFLSRGSDRGQELAVRAALGASRSRLVRQLLTESLVVSLIGGALGIFVGWALTAAVPALAPTDFPRLEQIQVDGRFLAVAALAAIFVGMAAGAAPALRGSRVDVVAAMQAGSARTVGGSGARLRRSLLIVEAALAVVLLVGAALVGRSFVELVRVDAGYEPAGVLTADLRLPEGARSPQRTWQVTLATLDRLRAMPGVRAAGAGDMAPFGSVLSSFGFALPGTIGADGRPVVATALRAVITPGYAEALGMRLKEGRLFNAHEAAAGVRAMLVNETFARTWLADGRPVTGRRFIGMFPKWLGPNTTVDIVGVVEDMLPDTLEGKPQSQIFVAHGPGADVGNATIVVKMDAGATSAAPLLRGVVRQLEPGATLERMGPLSAKISSSVGDRRFATFVLVAFASLALALASTGLYGVLSYTVAQRRREIGVRAALGATRGDLIGMVLREGLVVAGTGLLVGLGAAAIATRAMTAVLFGVTPLDPLAFIASAILLSIVAGAACVIPARRAAAIDPTTALRAE